MDYTEAVSKVGLFSGISQDELEAVLKCIGASVREIKRDGIVLQAGAKPEFIGIVLSGLLHVFRDDMDGNRALIAAVAPGEVFAEALCCAGVAESPVTVSAHEASVVMLLRYKRITRSCQNACRFHAGLIENMLSLVAEKNLKLQSRMEIISLKTVRAKVLRFLESAAAGRGRYANVPFNRQELADYLCVERSALSHELSRMKKDGLIEYWKNSFRLISKSKGDGV